MALILEKTLPNGVVANYHKIQSIDLLSGQIVMNLFVSKEARDANLIPIEGYEVKSDASVLFSESALSPKDTTPKTAVYAYLKTLPNDLNPTVNFAGAVDAYS